MGLLRTCQSVLFSAGQSQKLKSRFGIVFKKSLLVFACYLLSASAVYAERYAVEKDSFGNYSAKKLESSPAVSKESSGQADDPALDDNETVFQSGKAVQAKHSAESNLQADQLVAPAESTDVIQENLADVTENDEQSHSVSSENVAIDEQEPRRLSIFEQKYIEAELAERERILKAIKSGELGESDYDATQVNPEDFVDSEELLRSANKPIKENSPYYVTVDEQGRPQTTFYDPTLVKEILFTERNKKIEYTDAQIYKEGESEISIPESADPVALSILSGGSDQFVSYFEKFSTKCCDQLPNIQTPEITTENYHYFVLNEDSLPYRFAEGDSRFLLLRLPYLDKSEIPIRIRTFIRKFSDQNIDKGVFFPQIVTLNKDKEPLRIITGPLLKYQEETWTTHAYLQGIFALSQTKELDERYLLINTTRESLSSSSSIEIPGNEKGSARTVTLQHMNEGSFEIEILE